MDRRLGGPLPHQQANPTRVHLIPPEFFTLSHAAPWSYAVLAVISNCYPPVWGRLPTRYSPVRHSVNQDSIRKLPLHCFVRLACVRHAASVHPEPGSNSHVKVCFQVQNLAWLIFKPFYCCLGFVLNVLIHGRNQMAIFIRIFRVLHTVQFSRFFVVASAATFIVYQKFLLLSTLFYFFANPRLFEIFLSSSRIFKSFLSFRVLFLSLSRGRMLWYQSIPRKSSIFLNLLFYMFFCDF